MQFSAIMPRRKGREDQTTPAVDMKIAGERLRAQIASCISTGVLSKSVRPDWKSGSAFQLLEWAGDAALNAYLTQQIYIPFSAAGADEGAMSNVRAICNGNKCLARVFRNLDLSKLLRPPLAGGPTPNYLVDDKKAGDVIESIIGELFQTIRGFVVGSSADAGPSTSAQSALFSLLELIFLTGMEECPQRFRPTATETLLVHVLPTGRDEDSLASSESLACATGEANLCVSGQLAPEFYLIGAQKAATTSFASELSTSQDIVTAQMVEGNPEYYAKELHIFNNEERFAKGPQFWLSHFPEFQTTVRAVAIDCTPNYLLDAEVPSRLLQFYGEKASQLKFLIILRDPLSRTHSAFHHGQADGWWPHLAGKSFSEYVEALVASGGVGDADEGGPFADSLYGLQIARFFGAFSPSQFTIVPLRLLSTQDAAGRTAVQAVCHQLGVRPPQRSTGSVENRREHPRIEEELDAELIGRFRQLAAAHAGPEAVAHVLAAGQGVRLHGYTGESGDEASIASWLGEHW